MRVCTQCPLLENELNKVGYSACHDMHEQLRGCWDSTFQNFSAEFLLK